ncbi:MAG: calcium/sodium antiporter [Bdellovibrionales bacterium]|nr:calcium/sodium antiporter [Bdellovibrionales bacterium]
MITEFLILAVSLAALLYAADNLIETVVSLATRMGMSTMAVGLTVVAIGTSLPEVMASAAAAWKGHPDIAVGNVVGSNICNIGLILGLPALVVPVTCHRAVLRREGLLMILASIVMLVLAVFGGMSRATGLLFLFGFGWFIYQVFRKTKSNERETSSAENTSDEDAPGSLWTALRSAGFLGLLLLSSEFLVRSTVSLATDLGVSETVIAITVIALGTSLPELSVSYAAAKRKQGDILVGNILGSNIANILLVLGLSAVISPFAIAPATLYFDIPAMLLLAFVMVAFLWRERGVDRPAGLVLLSLYAAVIVRCVLYSAA